ncbi:MAG: hypothetical protein SCARUB_03674 [Candidatus Scalindua rubra]|uniref:Uncharacterized protein n=1 Tax=Candidatus Scalindua rubra TaxID=1872076 RepID=A0A1E3X6C1_9BACT|nr:MAG: hypothetical protein SCARUB_03674 [Candidatus Scalindua rubra]
MEEGKALKTSLEKVDKINMALSGNNLENFNKAKRILSEVIFVLENKISDDDPLHEKMNRLRENISSEDFYDRMGTIVNDTEEISNVYFKIYEEGHVKRDELYRRLEETAKGMSEWSSLPDDIRETILKDISSRYCDQLNLKSSLVCASCRATIMQMESDISAKNVMEQRIQQLIDDFVAKSDENIEKIKLSDYFGKHITSPDEFKEQLERFVQQIEGLLKEGKKIILE